jgi:hypothetical protein
VPSEVEDWSAIHDEVGRLPEKYRAPVILCYLEGQSYDEAARRIGCPVGTIRVRLSRARDKLRDRLTRRGFAPSALSAIAGLEGSSVSVGGAAVSPLPSRWVESTVKAAIGSTSARATAEVVSATVLVLSREVIRNMLMTHVKLAGVGLLSAGILATGVGVIGGQDPGPSLEVAPSRIERAQDVPKEQLERVVKEANDQLLRQAMDLTAQKILDAAKQRVAAQKAFYEEGRITIDRYLDALEQLREAKSQVAKSQQERVEAALDYAGQVGEVVKRESTQVAEGRSTASDLTEAQHRQNFAQLILIRAQLADRSPDIEALNHRVDTLEKKLDLILQRLDASGIKSDASTPKRDAARKR